jgi:hypothetical protein
MPVDLYRLYKGIYQRSHRNPDSELLEMMTNIAESIVKGDHSRREMLKLAKSLVRLEDSSGRFRTKYGCQFLQAILDNNFVIEVPHEISHGWKARGITGYIYIAASSQKKGAFKLGASTMSIEKRMQKYSSKHGYKLECVWSEYVREPFLIEKQCAARLRAYRLDTYTVGDSNEWYEMELVSSPVR